MAIYESVIARSRRLCLHVIVGSRRLLYSIPRIGCYSKPQIVLNSLNLLLHGAADCVFMTIIVILLFFHKHFVIAGSRRLRSTRGSNSA